MNVNVVPNIDNYQAVAPALNKSRDSCEITTLPNETQQTVRSSENVETVVESDPEELPSNQAFRRESCPNIDTQVITRLLQDIIKAELSAFEERLYQRLAKASERHYTEINQEIRDHFSAAAQQQQQHGIWIKQLIAAQNLDSGLIQQIARDQGLTTDVLKQIVITLKKRYGRVVNTFNVFVWLLYTAFLF